MATTQKTIKIITPGGKKVTVRLSIDGLRVACRVKIGKRMGHDYDAPVVNSERFGGQNVWSIGLINIGLDDSTAALAIAAYNELQSIIDGDAVKQAEIAINSLECDRQELVNAVNARYANANEERNIAWEHGDERRGVDHDSDADREYNDAVAALREFDASHPQIIAKIDEQKAADLKKNIWN